MPRFRRVIDMASGEQAMVPFTAEEEAAADAASAAEIAAYLPAAIKDECRRRIFAVANETAQMNMASHAAAGLFDAGKNAAYLAALTWVAEMRAACAALIAAADAAFLNDEAWPACPPDAAALAANY